MARVQVHSVGQHERKSLIGDFLDLILHLKTKQEVIEVLLGLMTPSEALMFARRVQIAKLRLEGKTFEEVREKLGVGFDTVGRIDDWLNTDDKDRDQWLAKELKRLQVETKTGRRPLLGPSNLDKWPEHRFMKDIINKILS